MEDDGVRAVALNSIDPFDLNFSIIDPVSSPTDACP